MSLRVRNLSAFHGRIEVCRGIGFDVAAGEIVVVLGPNGAGKSSTLGAIAGHVASEGAIDVDRPRPLVLARARAPCVGPLASRHRVRGGMPRVELPARRGQAPGKVGD